MTDPEQSTPQFSRKLVWIARGVSLAFALLLLLVAEGITRLATRTTNLDSILAVLEQHPDYLWRNRPNLDGTFRHKPVVTDDRGMRLPSDGERDGDGPLVVSMGASPTFGFGVAYEEAYPYQLQKRLRRATGKAVRVINAGMIGHSTFQGLALLKAEVLPLKPKVITIAYELNDLDKYRFFRSDGRPDSALEHKSSFLLSARNLLSRSAFFRVVERSLFFVMGKRDSTGNQSMEVHPPLSVRVPIPDYKKNLTAMIRLIRKQGIGVVLLRMPVNLPKRPPVPEADQKEAEALLARAVAKVKADDCAGAKPMLQKILKLQPNMSEAHYYLGSCARKEGDVEAAKKHVDDAMKAEGRRCGSDGVRYNEAVKQVARQTNTPLVDVVSAFSARDDYLFVDPKKDPTHPNPTGHAIIADLLSETILKHKLLQ